MQGTNIEEINAILVGAGEDQLLDELGRLSDTLGLRVVGRLEQNRRDGSGYLGRGKREELADIVRGSDADVVVTDDELTASQARVLEHSCGASVVDRTELIIRIFEAHARDAASRLEVELADLEYRLPRVKGRNPELSRLGGGAGGGRVTRGPGEQQLEYDRRAIRRRMEAINRKLKEERENRAVRGARLRDEGPPSVSLVGYTNAGKTTILNALSDAGRSTADRLFETLETTTRLVSHKSGGSNGVVKPDFVVTDTVGFIRKLPTQLLHSFAGTLEVAREADVVVLCADATSETLSEEIETASDILGDAGDILCLNKVDLLTEEILYHLRARYPSAVMVSALSDCSELLDAIYDSISQDRERMEMLIPHKEYRQASLLYGKAEIHNSEDTETGVWLDATLPESLVKRYERYRVYPNSAQGNAANTPSFR